MLRPEARKFSPDSQSIVQRTAPLLLVSVVAAVLFLVLVWLLLTTRYKETEQARGVLYSSGPTQKVTAPDAGRIVRWHVNEGDQVQKGELLATISRTLYDEEGNEISQVLAADLRDKRDLVAGEITLLQDRFSIDQQRLGRSLTQNENILKLLQQELALSNEQLIIGERQLIALQTLMKKTSATSRVELDRQRTTNLELRRQNLTADRQLQQQKARVDELQQQLKSLNLQNELTLLPLRKQQVELEQRISHATRSDNFVIVAEQPGRITSIVLAEGQPVRPNELMAQIGSIGNGIEAVIYVPSRVAGKITSGQEILLRFDAFDFHRYGRFPARVVHISEASLDPREALLPVPGLNEPVFRLVADIEQHRVSGPEEYSLQAGLLFTADFILEELPLLYFIFKPVLDLRGLVG